MELTQEEKVKMEAVYEDFKNRSDKKQSFKEWINKPQKEILIHRDLNYPCILRDSKDGFTILALSCYQDNGYGCSDVVDNIEGIVLDIGQYEETLKYVEGQYETDFATCHFDEIVNDEVYSCLNLQINNN
jgi:hypothetical protein